MKNVTLVLLLPFLLTLLAICGGCAYITSEAIKIPTPSQPTVHNITVEEASMMSSLSSFYTQFIDVRTPQEYAGGHIGNALNINYNAADFEQNVSRLDKKVRYIVYCQSGGRSAAASKVMVELGFQEIYNMTGGFSAWLAAGLSVNY